MMIRFGDRLPLDRPNERSLHVRPVPRTGGIGILAGTVAGATLAGSDWRVLLIALGLAALSFVDDVRSLSARVRFGAHFVAAAVFVAIYFAGYAWPWWVFFALGTIWMLNLYNFMDGIDGLAGGMTLAGFGAYAIAFAQAGATDHALLCATVAAAAAGFLVFNFHPAKVFMGDVGSIPLGFLAAAYGCIGWRDGIWPIWFPALVFAPFTIDASVTLVRRLARGEAPWQAHRSHYYQRLTQMGWGHRRTCLAEYALMLVCAAGALLARDWPLAAQAGLVAGFVVLFALLAYAIDKRKPR